MEKTLPNGLLDTAKNYLDITWVDEAGEQKLVGILLRGMGYLDHRAGVTLEYGEGDTARALLLDYARYVRAGALQDFGADFQGELMSLHASGEVQQHGANATE